MSPLVHRYHPEVFSFLLVYWDRSLKEVLTHSDMAFNFGWLELQVLGLECQES